MTATAPSFVGPAIDDISLLDRLPDFLVNQLNEANGYVAFGGGLHVRGACKEPVWHSLRAALDGPLSFHKLYAGIEPSDLPFAEDCMGDQFLLRDGQVLRLAAETGEIEAVASSFAAFMAEVERAPLEVLQMHPLLQFQNEGGALLPGELLSAYPPFFAVQSGERVSLRAIPSIDRRSFLADVAAQVRDVPDGGWVRFEVKRNA